MDASFGERKIHQILEDAGLNYRMEYIFEDLKSSSGRPLRFDFVIFDDDGNIDFIIEYIETTSNKQKLIKSSLKKLDCSNFDTSNVKSFKSMFENCESLTSLDVSNFDTTNVFNVSSIICRNVPSTRPIHSNFTRVKHTHFILAST